MMSVKACLLATVLLAATLTCGSASRVLLQEGRPSQCDPSSGKWEPWSVNCDFSCPSGSWEIDCQCKEKKRCTSGIKCKVDRDGAPDSEDIKFDCEVPSEGSAPNCANASSPDTCVADTMKAVFSAWKVSSKTG